MCAVSPFLSKFYGFPFGVDPRCCEIAYPLAFIYLSYCYSIARDDRWRLSVCLSSLLRSQFLWNLMKLCTVVWGRKTKTEFVGVKIRWCLSYFVPDFPPNFNNPNAFSMGRSMHCSIDARWPIVVVNTQYLARLPSAAARVPYRKMA